MFSSVSGHSVKNLLFDIQHVDRKLSLYNLWPGADNDYGISASFELYSDIIICHIHIIRLG